MPTARLLPRVPFFAATLALAALPAQDWPNSGGNQQRNARRPSTGRSAPTNCGGASQGDSVSRTA